MHNHFKANFKASDMVRLEVNNFNFKTLSLLEKGDLITPFSVEEVKLVMWDYVSVKSSRQNGINFGFIKEFRAELKCDVM